VFPSEYIRNNRNYDTVLYLHLLYNSNSFQEYSRREQLCKTCMIQESSRCLRVLREANSPCRTFLELTGGFSRGKAVFAFRKAQPALRTTKDIRASSHELRQSSRWQISEGPRLFTDTRARQVQRWVTWSLCLTYTRVSLLFELTGHLVVLYSQTSREVSPAKGFESR
jgi:hypothetical protein